MELGFRGRALPGRRPPPRPSSRRRGRYGAVLAGAALLCIAAAPAEALRDPVQEAHAHVLFRQVRCLAPLAADLRALVRQQVAAGRPDADIRAFLVKRYGEFVLLKPAFSPANALLWLTPFVIVLGGGATMALRRRPAGSAAEAPLDAAEEARLATLAPPPAHRPAERHG